MLPGSAVVSVQGQCCIEFVLESEITTRLQLQVDRLFNRIV